MHKKKSRFHKMQVHNVHERFLIVLWNFKISIQKQKKLMHGIELSRCMKHLKFIGVILSSVIFNIIINAMVVIDWKLASSHELCYPLWLMGMTSCFLFFSFLLSFLNIAVNIKMHVDTGRRTILTPFENCCRKKNCTIILLLFGEKGKVYQLLLLFFS